MKNMLLFFLLFTGMVNAQIVNIPDATLKAKLLAASTTDAPNKIAKDFSDNWMVIDTNGDGQIQVSEAQAVKLLAVSDFSINDITGLPSFSNLETLSLSYCNIINLDLNTMTSLKSLSCFSMVHMESLSINNLTNLTELNCAGCFHMTSLNVSTLTNLVKLYCINNSLATLNVNGLNQLTELACMANQLTNLNGLPTSLTKLNCGINGLTNLNLTGLTNLAMLDCQGNFIENLSVPNTLTYLNCSGNKITNLNVTGFNSLTELYCQSNEITSLNTNGLPSLTRLNCANNKLTSLSLSGLPNLQTLECSHNDDIVSVTLANLPSLQQFVLNGSVSGSSVTLSHLTNLSLSGLPNLQVLYCTYGLLTSLNLSGLTSLKEVDCESNLITNLNLTNLPNLETLNCSRNNIASIDATGLTNLVNLYCGSGYIENGQFVSYLTSINVVGLAHLKILYCSINQLSSLDLTGLTSLEELNCDGVSNLTGQLTSLDVNGVATLKKLSCNHQALTSLNVSNLTNLTDLNCSFNQISSLDLTGLINLQSLDYTYNQLASLNLVNLPSLTSLGCGHNQLTTLNVLNLTSLVNLDCSVNALTSLNLSGLTALTYLNFSYNQIALSNVSGLSPNLNSLYCDYNSLTSLNVSNLPNLEKLSCADNQLTSIDLSGLNNLKFLDMSNNQLSTINVSNLTLLEYLDVYQNLLTSLNLNGLTALKQLAYGYNAIPNLDVSFLVNLESLQLDNTQSTTLNVSALAHLGYLSCATNQLTTIDFSATPNLVVLSCGSNLLTTIDVSNCHFLNTLWCDSNQLTTLFMKNGISEPNLIITNNPTLEYICADNSQIESVQTTLNGLGMNGTVCNSYCSFTPGGNHNTITGICIFDADNNGCSATDVVNPFVRLNVTDGTLNGATVTNINGTYNFFTDAGTYTIAPNTENPTWFTFSPNSADFTFVNNINNISTQNFCIVAVGLHKDIEVVMTQLEPARPGFDAKYKIVYKNKGNQMQSGTVNLQFEDNKTDFVSATPPTDSNVTNSLSWNFVNLMPFENRSIEFVINLNSPVETPAVNNGDFLHFVATVNPIAGDELPSDNTFNYNQIVVGSLDPNDIICLEGDTVLPSEIGNYLHYAVNFENTGDYYAENVVVRLEIDADKFDMNSLQLLNSSNPSSTRITGNTVEFIMQNINLAAATGTPPVGGHGDVLFKIRTKDNLATNDTVLQRAGIYFDYNAPVVTNDAATTFAQLSNPIFEFDNSIKIYPNPAHSILHINSDFNIQSIELYDIQGRILSTSLENSNETTLDISGKQNGVYFLKINTENGSKVEKIVKE